ncbi:hypothetical protein Val02_53300 [Virgisporangium aliadipatigenens]|uniref:Uncharacterized protein n=2 Tax=Virgisporangium aliadipatigenens TaxID=741659 RepID=A0A8J4DS86_9ACTN|nr:hypothetical protein Val02_53300 [Virgisporangium aliadipatigenens]
MLGLSVAGVMAASPAQAYCKYSYLSVGSAYAEAYAQTADCSWQSRSYARHGSLVSGWTAWATVSSHAFADQGTASSAYAENQFR